MEIGSTCSSSDRQYRGHVVDTSSFATGSKVREVGYFENWPSSISFLASRSCGQQSSAHLPEAKRRICTDTDTKMRLCVSLRCISSILSPHLRHVFCLLYLVFCHLIRDMRTDPKARHSQIAADHTLRVSRHEASRDPIVPWSKGTNIQTKFRVRIGVLYWRRGLPGENRGKDDPWIPVAS